MKLFTLKSSLSFYIGRSLTTDPSIYLWLEVGSNGTIFPFSCLHISSTGEKTFGIAQDAETALHMSTFGEVK